MCPQKVQHANSLTTMMLGLPGPGFEFSERDCLNLNVFAPRYAEDVPVICYIHGGSSHGGNALPKNDATNIVKKSIAKGTPVAVVTVNYRLLPSAGLLESSQPQEGDHPRQADDRINWGLYDQKMALEWVRKHIHNFGGNPNEITLMGHSSGASPGGYHLMTAQHEGLFKRAIMHSVSGPTDASERGDSTQTIPERRMTLSSQLSAVADQGTKSDSKKFTFMSDACLPHMTEQERAVGFKVIDHWIDFAWGGGTGKDSISVSA
ncbi:Carboxylesterase family-domain-containing protein [Gamsiella multidivaricata]|uniref:Carboxylesterase family-domain-containing protein n=1 Tax=Gamsiella multidivaricata TaxID=101098 RepID=UPI0022209E1C|nr:Carboxylesterase family-domain-containing protein [Gamsiella multidivaricata]KAI7826612.1 Carboxylesterase family-domain-containing protein [Gamsiella multidivaricata]